MSGGLKSSLSEVGILDPGPIDNNDLIDDNKIKPNLVKDKHYKAVQPELWDFLWCKYGGGPILKRVSDNIYSAQLEPDQEQQELSEVGFLDFGNWRFLSGLRWI